MYEENEVTNIVVSSRDPYTITTLAISRRRFFFFFFRVDPYRYTNYTHNHKNAIETIDALHALVSIRAILPLMACANLH